jgi:para-nitrobenzyl esterase
MHLLSPLSKGLFHKAILQSGPCLTTPSLESALSLGDQFQDAVNCNISSNSSEILSCMRALEYILFHSFVSY